jgi:hypothetical protein
MSGQCFAEKLLQPVSYRGRPTGFCTASRHCDLQVLMMQAGRDNEVALFRSIRDIDRNPRRLGFSSNRGVHLADIGGRVGQECPSEIA